MRKEAKIGLAVVLVLGGVVAFIIYKGMQPRDAASNSRIKEPENGKSKPSSGEKGSGGLLDRWDDVPSAKAASDDDSGQSAQHAAAPGAAAQVGDGQDPFAGRSSALDRYASRYDQPGASDRQRLSIYGDDSEQQAAGPADEASAAPAPLPAAAGESVRRVSVYGPAESNGTSAAADGGNPLRGGASAAVPSGNTYGGTADAQGAYDPPGGAYSQQSEAGDASSAREAYGGGTTTAQGGTYGSDDGAWRRGAGAAASGATDRADGYGAAERGTGTYGANAYDKSGYAGGSYGASTDSRSQDDSQRGSRYDSSQQGSQYGSPGHENAAASAGAGYESASYGRSASAGLQPVPPAARATPGKYVVQPNDSCWLISRKLFGTGAYFKAIEEHNRHNYPRMDQLQVGDVLEVPSAEQLRAAYPDLCPKVRGAAPQNPRNYQVSATRRSGGGRVYVVQDGDNLFDIARYELGSAKRWVEIFDLNRELLSDDYDYLPVGAELILPDDPAGAADTVTERPGSPYSR